MNLPEVMVLLHSSLEKCDSCSLRELIRDRDKAVKQPEFLLEVAEELSDCPLQLSLRVRLVVSVVKVIMSCCATFDFV